MSEPGIPDANDLEDIQGLVYGGWNDHQYAGFLFATLGPDPRRSRRWLDELRPAVTPVARHRRRAPGRLQVALSPSGLAALGVPDDVIGALPSELCAGMASRRRALADSDPATWRLGGPGDRLDVLIMVYARDPAARAAQLDRQRAALLEAGAQVRPDELSWPLPDREHFGFADGLSQPFLPGLNTAPRRGEQTVPVGEILLGYPNAYGRLPISPVWDDLDLGKNGTFLVFRKLEQNVAAFWGWIAGHARRLAGGDIAEATLLADLIGAKLVGRWRSGASLVLAPDRDDPACVAPDRINHFKYLVHDPDGLRCPITSHVRRANPRDARGGTADESETVISRHRILRRGRSFGSPLPYEDALAGKDDGVTRGLYFICLQSSIARGFEFIQQTWLANPGFGGLHAEPDLIVADPAGRGHLTIPAEPVRLRLDNVPTVVTHVGGGYFFLPSLAALRRIAAGPRGASFSRT
ncbi:MAG TPA: Dyp-type peroxidase [Kofleriaceae bacterium]|nr:Dyp-type peroxidase [Kofleriaceae bacterium]